VAVTTPSPEAERPASRVPWLVAAVLLVVVGGAVGWWFVGFPASEPTRAKPEPARRQPGGPPYVAAEHVDGEASRLVAAPEGGGGRLEVVLRDVTEGETLKVTMRSAGDPKHPTVFVDRGAPTSSIGMLHATSEGTGKPGESRLAIDLPTMPDGVTVVDLRWGGRWQGFEVKASR
jgi:hypothetical protein